MTKTPTPASHAVNTAPISADLRGIEQSAARSADRDTHFYLAGWNGARGNEDSHEHFRRAMQAAPSATAGPEIAANSPDLLPPMGIRNDRDMLNYKMGAFDSEVHYCARCGHDEATKDMDSASLLRDYLAAAPAQAVAVPLQQFESPRAQILLRVFQEGWGACRDAEYVGEEAENDAFNRSVALGHCIAEDQLHRHFAALAFTPAQEHATQLAGQKQTYSIDADPQGIRARVADAITGALGLGAQGSGNPPPDHWLTPFWNQARFGQIQYNALRDSAEAMLNAPGALTQAARDVLAERQRQVEREGYDPEHDDSHELGEIGALAALYLMPQGAREWDTSSTEYGATLGEALLPADWSMPKMGDDPRQDLVKGAACGLAELERFDRAAARAEQGGAA